MAAAETTPLEPPPFPKRATAAGDRLSALPDELLLPILIAADLDLTTAVQTSLFSTHWRNIWKSILTSPHFETSASADRRRFRLMVESTLAGRNSTSVDLASLSLATHDPTDAELADVYDRIYSYGSAHRVKTFRFTDLIRTAINPFSKEFTSLCATIRHLDISARFDLHRLITESSDFPNLTSLRLHRCQILPPAPAVLYDADGLRRRYAPFELIPNLEKLELIHCVLRTTVGMKLSGEKLEEIVIIGDGDTDKHIYGKMYISAPRCRYLECRGMYLDKFVRVELPSLERLEIEGRVRRQQGWARAINGFRKWEMEKAVEASLKFIQVLEMCCTAQSVTLHPNAIQELTAVPGLLKTQSSPFKGVKSLEIHGTIATQRAFNTLISYFFGVRIRGSDLFKRTHNVSQGSTENSSRPAVIIVHKSDLPMSGKPADF